MGLELQESEKEDDSEEEVEPNLTYRNESCLDAVRSRGGWLVFFFLGLMFAACVIEEFRDMLGREVELNYFVPLLIGHGGNTGSQAVASVIRALAYGHVAPSDLPYVLCKEAITGCLIGMVLGIAILLVSFIWSGLSIMVGLTVAIALPVVSLWANTLGGLFPLLAIKFGYNPAVTSIPLMTTVVDSSGLLIYFYIARWMLPGSVYAADATP